MSSQCHAQKEKEKEEEMRFSEHRPQFVVIPEGYSNDNIDTVPLPTVSQGLTLVLTLAVFLCQYFEY